DARVEQSLQRIKRMRQQMASFYAPLRPGSSSAGGGGPSTAAPPLPPHPPPLQPDHPPTDDDDDCRDVLASAESARGERICAPPFFVSSNKTNGEASLLHMLLSLHTLATLEARIRFSSSSTLAIVFFVESLRYPPTSSDAQPPLLLHATTHEVAFTTTLYELFEAAMKTNFISSTMKGSCRR
ncbi:hypothetical protein PIB30_097678, partial [Stylosanthes scabra]|nr:hypothetical protein [Stylosanthes scabra]